MAIEDKLSRLAREAAKRRIAASSSVSGFFLTQTSESEIEETCTEVYGNPPDSLELVPLSATPTPVTDSTESVTVSNKATRQSSTSTINSLSSTSGSHSIVSESASSTASQRTCVSKPKELVLLQMRKRRERQEREQQQIQLEQQQRLEKQRQMKAADEERLKKVLADAERRRTKAKEMKLKNEREETIRAQQTAEEEAKRKEQAREVMRRKRQKRLEAAKAQRSRENAEAMAKTAEEAKAKAKQDLAKAEFMERDRARLEKIRENAKRRDDETREKIKHEEEIQAKEAEESARVEKAKQAMRAQQEAIAKEKTRARLRQARLQRAKAEALAEKEMKERKKAMDIKAAKLLHDTKVRLRSQQTSGAKGKAKHNPLGLRAAVSGLANMRAAAKRRRSSRAPPLLGMLSRSNNNNSNGKRPSVHEASPFMPDMAGLSRRDRHKDLNRELEEQPENNICDGDQQSGLQAGSTRGTQLCGTPLDEVPALLLPRLLPNKVAQWAAQSANKSNGVDRKSEDIPAPLKSVTSSATTSTRSSPRSQSFTSMRTRPPRHQRKVTHGGRARRKSAQRSSRSVNKSRASGLLQRALEWKRQQQHKTGHHSSDGSRDESGDRQEGSQQSGAQVLMQADHELSRMGRHRPQIPSSVTSVHNKPKPTATHKPTKTGHAEMTSSRQEHLPLVGGVLSVPRRTREGTRSSTRHVNTNETTGSTSKQQGLGLGLGLGLTQEGGLAAPDADSDTAARSGDGDGYSEDSFDDLDDMLEGGGTSDEGPECNDESGQEDGSAQVGRNQVVIRPGSRRSEALLSLERDCAARMIQLSFLQYKHIKRSKQRRTKRGETQAEELRALRIE
jgi:hypothetical protein